MNDDVGYTNTQSWTVIPQKDKHMSFNYEYQCRIYVNTQASIMIPKKYKHLSDNYKHQSRISKYTSINCDSLKI
jgi:hypothetical protein